MRLQKVKLGRDLVTGYLLGKNMFFELEFFFCFLLVYRINIKIFSGYFADGCQRCTGALSAVPIDVNTAQKKPFNFILKLVLLYKD